MTVQDVVPARGGVRSTSALAEFVAATSYEDLPEAVVEAVKKLVLDEIVVVAAAMNTPMAEALLKLKADPGGAGEATVLVDGRRIPAANAVYIHGQLANLLDADETMHNRMHTVSASVLSGLAIAQRDGSSGKDLITAIATGYDITSRIGASLKQYVSDGAGGTRFAPKHGFSWMSVGAAGTVGRLLGLDASQIARAFGQAFTTTPVYFDIQKHLRSLGREGVPASWHKYQMSGAYAAAGLDAAQLVSYGWVAQDDVFDEGGTFWQSFASPGVDWEALYGGLGTRWYITETSFKWYPFCRFGHQGLDIFSGIVEENALAADDIAEVVQRIIPDQLARTLATTTYADEGLKLMASMPTALSLIAHRVPPGPRWFDDAVLNRPEVRRFAERVTAEVVDEWGPSVAEQLETEGFFAKVPTEIIVRTRSGAEFSGRAEYAHGDPWTSEHAFDYERIADKARLYLDGILPAQQIEDLIGACREL
ncbi:MmgE/PrpD family protein, partial [Rhodococcus sp. 14C212]|uniref:MmgE/PrpD family protein n=1 Tax=Rhodococcus sp. 14C212 TaxID=2711209 RepID=UPI0013EE11A8